MLRYFLLLLLALPLSIFAQDKLGKTLPDLKKELNAFVLNNKSLKPVLSQQEKELRLVISNEKGQTIRFEYRFEDSTGLCNQEITISACQTCYQQLLDELVSKKIYEWKRINESQFVSKFSDYLMIEMQEDGKDFSFTLIKTAWTRELYDLMLKN